MQSLRRRRETITVFCATRSRQTKSKVLKCLVPYFLLEHSLLHQNTPAEREVATNVVFQFA